MQADRRGALLVIGVLTLSAVLGGIYGPTVRATAAGANDLNEAVKTMERPTPEALWLGVRLERKLGNKAGEGSYASQLRSRYPTSKEYQLFLKGNFE